MTGRTVLALNAGSSSLKFALFAAITPPEQRSVLLRGSLTGADTQSPHFTVTDGANRTIADEDWQSAGGIERVVEWIEGHLGADRLIAAGHRVVHGGREFVDPVLIDPQVLTKLDALTPLAPLHQPASLAPIRALAKFRPDLSQYACFDTAFHHGLTPPASRYALPRLLEDEGVRRYGFHGLSYEAIAAVLAERADGAARERIIVAHLGSGASACALRDLKSVDTTMGFTALDGLMMGTRPGTLDPGILIYLLREKAMDAAALETLLYHESGLKGVSGLSGDVRDLLASDSPAAREALDLFALLAAKQIAGLVVTLGGLDRLIFTGGIGEHAWQIRAMIGAHLEWLGLRLDADLNAAGKGRVSAGSSTIAAEVIPTDEEGVIAMHVLQQIDRSRR